MSPATKAPRNTPLRSASLVAIALLAFAGTPRAQFSHAVVVMKGTVRAEDNARPTSVRVSVRPAGDTGSELTSSISNKSTGKYLVVLKPGKSYWFHLEGDSIMTKDILVTTPPGDRTQQLEQDFTVVTREAPAAVGTTIEAKKEVQTN